MSMVSAVREMDRLRQIAQVLVKHGFGALVARMGLGGGEGADTPAPVDGAPVPPRSRLGERLRLVLQELGPTFVKLGQMASTRPDVLPADIVRELKKLQDDVAPFPVEEARAQIEASLGAPVDQLFDRFEDEPLACASMAQVHRARLRDGDAVVDVAVKIQRPGIIAKVAADLHLLHRLARMVESAVPESRVYSPVGLVREFDRAINAELDFTVEALNAGRFARNFEQDAAITFPRVFEQVSGRHVLTLEFLDGLKVNEAVLERGADGVWIAETSVRLLLKMVFEDGFFHADPHPGNVLILPRPADSARFESGQPLVIGLLDLGLVGRLSPELRDRTVDLLLAAARNDPDAIADALLAIGRPRERVDHRAFREHVRAISERHLGRPLRDMEASAIVRDIVMGAIQFGIEIPVELTMMLRALMTIEGVGKEIHPELDVLQVARPYLTRIIVQRYHPARIGGELLRGATRLSTMARDLPFQLQEIVEDARHGRLQVRTVDAPAASATERLGRRIRAGLVFAAQLGGGVALLATRRDLDLLAWALVVGALAWLLLHLALDLRRRS